MKKSVLSLVMIGLAMQSFAQTDVLFEAKLTKEDVPVVVIDAIEEDFPDYSVVEYNAIPLEFIDEDVIVNKNIDSNDDYDTYEITLQGKGQEFDATYDGNGDLISTYEFLKNVAPPEAVRNSIAKVFPKWKIEKDNYKMTHYTGKKAKERYKLVITKGKQRMVVYTESNGNIFKVR